MRILTWNVFCDDEPFDARQPVIRSVLEAAEADVIFLQESWRKPDGTDQAEQLATALGLGYVESAKYLTTAKGWDKRVALLSRWPMSNVKAESLVSSELFPDDDRVVLLADVDSPAGTFVAANTHLAWRPAESARRCAQVAQICEAISQRSPFDAHITQPNWYAPVLCGDLNAVPDSDEVRMLTGKMPVPSPGLAFYDAWEARGDRSIAGFTWDRDNPFQREYSLPDRRLDFILVNYRHPDMRGVVRGIRIIGDEPVDGIAGSDHYGLVADLDNGI